MATVFFEPSKNPRKSGTWRMSWYEDGKRKSYNLTKENGVTTQEEAEAFRKSFESEQFFGAAVGKRKIIPFDQYARHVSMKKRKKYKSDNNKRRDIIIETHLIPFFKDKPLHTFKKSDCLDYEHYRADQLVTQATITKEVAVLKSIFAWAYDIDEAIEKNKIARHVVESGLASKPTDFFKEDELRAIFEKCTYSKWWKFLAYTGLRRAEFFNIEKDWIDKNRREMQVLSIDETQRTKSKHYRILPLMDGALEALDEFDETTNGRLIQRESTPNALSMLCIRDLRNKAKVKGNIHMFRHSYISHLILQGTPPRRVQELAGHGHFSVTEGYIHALQDSHNGVKLVLP